MQTKIQEICNIFICVNEKQQGKCCASANAEEIFAYFKDALVKYNSELDSSKKFKVVKTSCLGRCSIGPNIFISPDNVWYNYSSKQDIDMIICQHLIARKVVPDLLNKAVHTDT